MLCAFVVYRITLCGCRVNVIKHSSTAARGHSGLTIMDTGPHDLDINVIPIEKKGLYGLYLCLFFRLSVPLMGATCRYMYARILAK